MNILAIENSLYCLSLALKKERLIYEGALLSSQASKHIVTMVKNILEEAELDISDIDVFSLGLGPGSFTGLRIACSVVKGFCLALDKPVIGFSSFIAIAQEYSFLNRNTAVIFDARKGLIYGGVYKTSSRGIKPLIKEKLSNLDYFLRKFCDNNCVFVGESIKFKERIKKFYPQALISEGINYPKAKFILTTAEKMYLNKKFIDLSFLEPIYLHPEACQAKRRKSSNTGFKQFKKEKRKRNGQ